MTDIDRPRSDGMEGNLQSMASQEHLRPVIGVALSDSCNNTHLSDVTGGSQYLTERIRLAQERGRLVRLIMLQGVKVCQR